MAKTRFCEHAFGLDVYNVFGTSGIVRGLQEGPGGSRDGSRNAPRRPCRDSPLLEPIFSQKCSKQRAESDPDIVQKLVQKWSLKITQTRTQNDHRNLLTLAGFWSPFCCNFVLLAKRARDGSQRAFTWLQEGSKRAPRRPR